jgi:hypothetical protein
MGADREESCVMEKNLSGIGIAPLTWASPSARHARPSGPAVAGTHDLDVISPAAVAAKRVPVV